MPRYKITQHITGWKLIGNFIDAKDEDEAWDKWSVETSLIPTNILVNKEWEEIEEEYKVTDTELEKVGDTPTEGVKKWRENKEQGHKEWKKELDRIYKED